MSTTLKAAAGSMLAATAATLPFAIATSRTALILFLGSMTCPPFSWRSYFCCASRRLRQQRTRRTQAAFLTFTSIASTPPVVVPPGRPLRRQVFAHIERARHLVTGDLSGETETQRITVPLG